VELTETAYRLQIAVTAGGSIAFDAVLERPRLQRVELVSLPFDGIQVWAANEQLSAEIRAALRQLAALRAELSDGERLLAAAQQSRGAVVDDQGRIRENLRAVPDDSDLSRRYLDELSRQEDRLAELDAEIERLRGARDDAE